MIALVGTSPSLESRLFLCIRCFVFGLFTVFEWPPVDIVPGPCVSSNSVPSGFHVCHLPSWPKPCWIWHHGGRHHEKVHTRPWCIRSPIATDLHVAAGAEYFSVTFLDKLLRTRSVLSSWYATLARTSSVFWCTAKESHNSIQLSVCYLFSMFVFCSCFSLCFVYAPCCSVFSCLRRSSCRVIFCARGSMKLSLCTSRWKDVGASSADLIQIGRTDLRA